MRTLGTLWCVFAAWRVVAWEIFDLEMALCAERMLEILANVGRAA